MKTAMHDDVYSHMQLVLGNMHTVMMRTVPFEMTHEECLDLTAPKNHHEILMLAGSIGCVSTYDTWVQLVVPDKIDGVGLPEVRLQMRTHAEKMPPIAPKNPLWQPGVKSPAVVEWLTKRYEFGRKFASASAVVKWLWLNCESSTQVRYMFPPITHLIKPGGPRVDRWIEKHAAYKTCKSIPAVSLQLKQAMLDAGALLTSVALIGNDVPDKHRTEVLIRAAERDGQLPTFDFCGEQINRM